MRDDLYRLIIDNTSAFVSLLSINGTVLNINQATLSFLGLNTEQVLRHKLWDIPWVNDNARLWLELLIAGLRRLQSPSDSSKFSLRLFSVRR